MENIKITRAATLKEKPDSSKLVFGKNMTDHMFLVDYDEGQGWHDPRIVPYGPLQIDPAAKVLHYAEEIFEGLKAYTTKDGRIVCFRPELNARRMAASCRRLCMPEYPEEQFLEAVKQTVLANAQWVPPYGYGASLYLRPVMFGTGAVLGKTEEEKGT